MMTSVNGIEPIPIKERAWSLCKEYLSGSWANIDPEDLVIQQLSGGLSNHVFYCSLPKGIKSRNHEPTEVLLRIYGRHAVAHSVVDNVVFTLLSERNLGPRLHGVFPEGRLEEYIPARSMYPNEIRDPHFSGIIAKKIARIHGMNIPVIKEPTFIEKTFRDYLSQMDRISVENVSDPDQREIALRVMDHDLASEVDWLLKFMARSNTPTVFCHHDLQGGNILVRHEEVGNTEDRIVFIDYEFAAYGYRAFDLANHFCEWMFDYTNKDFPYYYYMKEKFPSKESQMKFFYEYIQCLEIATANDPSRKKHCSGSKGKGASSSSRPSRAKSSMTLEQQAEIIYTEVQNFLVGPNLLWALWGISQSDHTDIKFGYWKYAEDRLKEYFALKNNLLLYGTTKRPHDIEDEDED